MKSRFTYAILFLGLLCSAPLYAQDGATTLEDRFEDIIIKSNRYEDYKVVKRYKLDNLQKNVNDTIGLLKSTISQLETDLSAANSSITNLNGDLTQVQANLTASQDAENKMTVFGIQTSKGAYNTLMWSILGVLLLLLLIFIFRFKNSNSVTKEAKTKLKEVEQEFESHRQRSLEREQQIRRKLQDEINKNKKAQA